jgi:ABC-type Mn2+/Zn2+ transport system permease subunit
MNGLAWKRAARVFLLLLVIMIAVAFFGVISVARQLSTMTDGTAQFALLGIPTLAGTKSGSESTLQAQIGLVLVLAVPILAAVLTAAISSRSWRGRSKEPDVRA